MNENTPPIDEIDIKILNLLLQDAKATYRELASKLGLAIGTVNNRIKKLERSGVITKYTVNLDYEKLGYNIEVLIFLKISKGNFYEVSKKVIKDPQVYLVFDMTGEWDAIILARFRSKGELDEYIKKLQKDEDILETNTKLVLNILREKVI